MSAGFWRRRECARVRAGRGQPDGERGGAVAGALGGDLGLDAAGILPARESMLSGLP